MGVDILFGTGFIIRKARDGCDDDDDDDDDDDELQTKRALENKHAFVYIKRFVSIHDLYLMTAISFSMSL